MRWKRNPAVEIYRKGAKTRRRKAKTAFLRHTTAQIGEIQFGVRPSSFSCAYLQCYLPTSTLPEKISSNAKDAEDAEVAQRPK